MRGAPPKCKLSRELLEKCVQSGHQSEPPADGIPHGKGTYSNGLSLLIRYCATFPNFFWFRADTVFEIKPVRQTMTD